jgi:Secretion system C-terminal sorting domain
MKAIIVFYLLLMPFVIVGQAFPTGPLIAALPGPSLSTTPLVLSTVTALDGVAMQPSISLGGTACSYTTAGSQAGYDNDQFQPAPQNSTSPMALQIRLPSPAVNCPNSFIKTKLNFTTGGKTPVDLTFRLADVDNRYDSGRIFIYSAGSLVTYNYTLSSSTAIRVFNGSNTQLIGLSGSGNNLHFNGTGNTNVNPTTNWDRGSVYINTPPNTVIDSIIYLRYFFASVGQAASTTIGDFAWPSNVLSVPFTLFKSTVQGCTAQVQGQIADINNIEQILLEEKIGTQFNRVASMVASSVNFSFKNIMLHSKYSTYRVKLLYRNGTTQYSSLIPVVSNCIESSVVTIAPNPVTNKQEPITLYFSKAFTGSYSILTPLGKLVQTATNLQQVLTYKVNIQNLVSGVYYLQIKNVEHSLETLKFIIK